MGRRRRTKNDADLKELPFDPEINVLHSYMLTTYSKGGIPNVLMESLPTDNGKEGAGMPQGNCARSKGAAGKRPCCRRSGGASVEPAVLAVLLAADGYGYDLRKSISAMTGGELDADVGGLYRALRRLEEGGALVSRWCEDEGSGPRRREYELTPRGVELARQWLVAMRRRERVDRLLGDMLEQGLVLSGNSTRMAPCCGCPRAMAAQGRAEDGERPNCPLAEERKAK